MTRKRLFNEDGSYTEEALEYGDALERVIRTHADMLVDEGYDISDIQLFLEKSYGMVSSEMLLTYQYNLAKKDREAKQDTTQ